MIRDAPFGRADGLWRRHCAGIIERAATVADPRIRPSLLHVRGWESANERARAGRRRWPLRLQDGNSGASPVALRGRCGCSPTADWLFVSARVPGSCFGPQTHHAQKWFSDAIAKHKLLDVCASALLAQCSDQLGTWLKLARPALEGGRVGGFRAHALPFRPSRCGPAARIFVIGPPAQRLPLRKRREPAYADT